MGKIKVLPVYPEFPLTFWSYKKALEYIGKKAVMPPTGLATVLSMLPQNKFEPQKIIDLNVELLKDKEVQDSDIIFTSTMIVQEDSHNELIEKAHFYGKKVVAGGPFPTSYPERNKKADYIIEGEAEITLMPFLEDLLKGKARRIYTEENITKEGHYLTKLTKTGKADISQTPIPRWDLLDLSRYHSPGIQYSRGCPKDCEFCDVTKLFGREPRTKTPQQMILELDAVYNAGHRGNVMIVDDNIIGNKRNLKELLPEIIAWQQGKKYPFNFFTEASMDLAWETNNDILEGLSKAGFSQIFMGIESLDEEVLEKTNKKQNTVIPQLEAVKKIQRAGIEVTGGFIIGLDGEKPDVFDQLFKFIQEAGIVVPMPGLLTVLKGTKLYHRLEKEGRIKGESSGNNTHNLSFNFKTELDEKILMDGYKKLLENLFEPKNYYERCRTLQKNLGKGHRPNRKNLEGLIAFGRSLKNQLFAAGGIEYSKYIFESALKNPSYFPEAVTQAIKLDHFRTITKATLEADSYVPETKKWFEQFKEKAKEISAKYQHDFAKSSILISEIARNIIIQAEKKYQEIHKDFRENPRYALNNLKRNLDGELKNYERN